MQRKIEYLPQQDEEYFISQYNLLKDKNGKISFDNFAFALNEFLRIDKVHLEEDLEKLRTTCTKKQGSDATIFFTEADYYKNIEDIFRQQDLRENMRDPEMRVLFENLTNGGDTLQKSFISSIITDFGFPIDLEKFFAPIGKKDRLTFNDFCLLFKNRGPEQEIVIQTFYSTFSCLESQSANTQLANEIFPIKYVPH